MGLAYVLQHKMVLWREAAECSIGFLSFSYGPYKYHEVKVNSYNTKHPSEIGQEDINHLGETGRHVENAHGCKCGVKKKKLSKSIVTFNNFLGCLRRELHALSEIYTMETNFSIG